MTVILKVDHLSVHNASNVLVKALSFELKHFQNITILGESGSGKSLLANAIIGNLAKDLHATGEIELFGQPQSSKSQQQRESLWGHKIAILPQEPWLSLDPIMRIDKQVEEVHEFVMKDKKNDRKYSLQAFVKLGLDSHQSKYPHQLSGGMAQRAAYICATQTSAPLLIADEPTKGLDASRKQQIIDMLSEHNKIGSVLSITHDIEVAQALGGEIIVIKDGIIQERGPSDKILNHPQADYTKALIAADPRHWQTIALNRPNEPIIKVSHLSLKRGSQLILDNLSFDICQGEVVGISGDSGSGKSSLADVLLGLIQPTKGSIEYLKPFTKGKYLKLYQDPPSALARTVTLKTLLNDLAKYHDIDKNQIPSLMQKLNLSAQLLERNATKISGGELQRFAILRALLMQPELLIADEPTSRLDPITAAETLKLIIELTQQYNCALVLISHDKHILEKNCHKVIQV